MAPTSSAEVADVLSTLVGASCSFAVLSGGHSQYAGDSSAPAGVTIDLGGLNDVQLVGDDRVRIGMGLNLSAAYAALSEYNITSLLGHSAGVGVGGYTLGGGLSSLSHRYGFGFDNTFEYEVRPCRALRCPRVARRL